MAHLWIETRESGWTVVPLGSGEGDDMISLAAVPVRRAARAAGEAPPDGVVLWRRSLSGRERWILLADRFRAVRVNGLPLLSGIRVLEDKDAIETAEIGTAFFSTEVQARVEPLRRGDPPVHCPRCRQAIEAETPAVRCPACDLWYHETDDLPCWSFGDRCAMCPQATDLSAGFRFSPEDL